MVFVIFAVYFKKMLNNRAKSILHFHLIVFIFGFTSILGVLIEKEAIALVWYRMLIASVFLTLFIFFFNKKKFEFSYNLLYKLVAAGFLIAAHWVSFFYAIKMVGVSPTLAMLSSGALMTAILEPVFYKQKILFYEVLFGGITMIGMFVIFKTSPDDWLGMLVALIATVLGVFFTLINGLLIKENSSVIITLGEMITGVGFISLFLLFGGGFDVSFFTITTSDFLFLMLLGTVCTAYAITFSIEVMKQLNPFTIMLIINMEPIYGILLALLIFGESELMSSGFYIGLLIILFAIVSNSIVKVYKN
ncbi:MAG: DMT family transporter [Flavobacteriaceae bacterium]|jgi:drug/metabolite transporter (DMT)-like permease